MSSLQVQVKKFHDSICIRIEVSKKGELMIGIRRSGSGRGKNWLRSGVISRYTHDFCQALIGPNWKAGERFFCQKRTMGCRDRQDGGRIYAAYRRTYGCAVYRPDVRGQGIGKRLVEHALTLARG